jgi:hypothetical protein
MYLGFNRFLCFLQVFFCNKAAGYYARVTLVQFGYSSVLMHNRPWTVQLTHILHGAWVLLVIAQILSYDNMMQPFTPYRPLFQLIANPSLLSNHTWEESRRPDWVIGKQKQPGFHLFFIYSKISKELNESVSWSNSILIEKEINSKGNKTFGVKPRNTGTV